MKYLFILSAIFFSIEFSFTQSISGVVLTSKGEFLEGATIKWLDSDVGALSDFNGKFQILKRNEINKLIVSYTGFANDTILVNPNLTDLEIRMVAIQDLQEVTISSKRQDSYVSTLQTHNIETLTSCELKNAPCCSLAESFETNATVDVVQTDAVTGTKEIQMLGLKGIYTQVLLENRPDLGGIASSYALDYIPGTWIESIQISKGASTVANGFQAITGQINAELIKPFKEKPLFLNAYSNHDGRYEVNLHLNHKYNSPWSQGLLLHASGQQYRGDHDNDGFIDNILRTTYTGLYRVFYNGTIWNSQLNFLFVNDDRKSGQFTHNSNFDNEDSFYHINQSNKRYEAFGKLAYLGLKGKQESLGFQWHAIKHEIANTIGIRPLEADETDLQATLLYKNNILNEDNTINIGGTAQLNKSTQFFDQSKLEFEDKVAGVHAEYSYTSKGFPGDKSLFMRNFGLVAGIRLDHHNYKGWFFVPRINIKYNFTEESIIRFSAGRGLRRARPFTDYINRMANNRTWIIEPKLPLEDAWNVGGNFSQNFKFLEKQGQITVDLYKIIFQDQVILDADADLRKIFVYSLLGRSSSTTFQIAGQYEVFSGLNIKAAYKFSKVKLDYLEGYRDALFIPQNRYLFTAVYKTLNQKWQFNALANYTGQMRLPDIDGIPDYLLHGATNRSLSFWRYDIQVTHFMKNFEIYSGIENLLGYTQHHAILQHDFPTGEYFDAGRVYAPLNGRMFNLGFRFWLDRKDEDKTHDH